MRSKLSTLITLSLVICFYPAISAAQVNQAETKTQEEATHIAGEIAECEDLKTLAKALEAAKLTEAMKGKGPFTVFAPTDEAFKKVGAKNLEELLKEENREKLVAILKAHVAAGTWTLEKIKSESEIPTVDGGALTVTTKDDKVMVGDATIDLEETIECKNGLVFCIDEVLPAKQ